MPAIIDRQQRQALAKVKAANPRLNVRLLTVPRMWPGSTVYILGGGPGIRRVPIARLEGKCVIAVNNAFRLAPWIPVMFFGDYRWYFPVSDDLDAFGGLKLTTQLRHADKPGVRAICHRDQPFGISRNPSLVLFNKSSGGCAINVAVHLGAARIVLFGFDMRLVDGEKNYHREHEDARLQMAQHGRITKKVNPYPNFLRPFPDIARDLKSLDIKCINATPGSALTLFPIANPEDVV